MANYIVRKNNVISIIRGDSFSFNLNINELLGEIDGESYTFSDNDKVYFALMYPNSYLADSILVKEYTLEDLEEDGSVTISLKPDDTVLFSPGTYYYTVKLALYQNTNEEEIHTLIPQTKFFILE